MILLSLILIGNGCAAFQPVSRVTQHYNFIDYDAQALRLAKPVRAELLSKNSTGEWVSIGKGTIPAGAYIKGRAPQFEGVSD